MNFLQYLSLFLTSASIYLSIYWIIKDDKIKPYLIGVLTWLGHAFVFYVTRFIVLEFNLPSPFGEQSFTRWSSLLRFHGVFLIFCTLFVLSNFTEVIEKLWKTLFKRC